MPSERNSDVNYYATHENNNFTEDNEAQEVQMNTFS